MLRAFKRFLVGQPLATSQAIGERLSKRDALAVFSSDALSSVAYATEEILLVLAVAAAYSHDTGSFWYVLPISLTIAVLLWLATSSYRQTIHAYPSGGGAYIVAKENLGTYAGLTAAAALLVDYVLTVSVSVAPGRGGRAGSPCWASRQWLSRISSRPGKAGRASQRRS